uniref:Type I polyketide synthase n=1 Tax=Gambierdiscus polynesiensis TaxID=439318 RepID=A0A1S6K7U4_9DINO|nr:type I polyketide synthase [Gambierdiscus polynesiensis]
MAAELGGSLEGRIVDINGNGRYMPVAREEEHEAGWTQLPDTVLDNQQGWCLGFSEETREYTVQTFSGLMANVPEDCVKAWVPDAAPEDGGCDLKWPDEAEPHAIFGSVVADCLTRRGRCVIQMNVDKNILDEAVAQVKELEDFERMREEAVIDYLGRDNFTKVKQMADDVPEDEPSSALGVCDRYISTTGFLFAPEAVDSVGCELIGRTNGFARVPCANKAEASALTPPYSDEEVAAGRVEGFFQWVQSRKVCIIFVLEGEEGGEIILHPSPSQGGDDVRLPISGNKMFIFRHDVMSYTYVPRGPSTALQAWLLSGLPSVELRSISGQQKDYAENLRLTGPWQPEGEQALVKSLMVRMPGRSWGYYNYWNMFTAGCDCVLEWTNTRWETELYYEEDRDKAMMMGKSYMHHGGFLDETEFNCFDNSFFGLSPEETMCLYPGQRIVMEVGYESLYRAGYTRSQAAGEMISVQVGDVGPDWHSADSWWPYLVEGDFVQKRVGVNAGITCTRLSHFLNLIGPTNSVATACSSSLVALNIAHHNMANQRDDKARVQSGKSVYERALVVGINTLMGPFSFMGQCTMGGTTYKGRSFTFDTGADGYQRGEGCSATFIQMNSEESKNADRLACVIGSAVNQDGRSASLTAPNGPSQAALCRDAMKMARLQPVEVTAAECHGTGTALGDPIEIGALQNVLSKRDRSILKTSAKSNMAHLEASAGMAGFAKCIMMILGAATPPNLHLKILNPHLIVEGYPVYFTTEITPWGQNSGYCGVSSFGIGGTNARGEIIGRCQRGPENTGQTLNDLRNDKIDFVTMCCPRCEGKMLFPCGTAVPQPLMQLPLQQLAIQGGDPEQGASGMAKLGKYRSTLIRDEFADYSFCSDCYQDLQQGEFRCGSELQGIRNPNKALYIRGTWDGFSGLEEMTEVESGEYCFTIALGETRCERFQILLERSRNLVLYPVRTCGDQSKRILGPDQEGLEKYWMIDARDTDVAAGTVYRITFSWEGDRKRISWAPLADEEASPEERTAAAGQGYRHRYQVLGSWTSFKPMDMVCRGNGGLLYEAAFTIGPYGAEEFQIMRDCDPQQIIYPAALTLSADSVYADRKQRSLGEVPMNPQRFTGRSTPWDVPIRGPDEWSRDNRFKVQGLEGESISIQLRIVDAHVSISLASRSLGKRSWESVDGLARKTFFVTGSFNDWSLSPMSIDDEEPGTFVFRLELQDFSAEFQLIVDADPLQKMYPQLAGASSGEGFLEGPDAGPALNDHRFWSVQGQPYAVFDVRFRPKSQDRRQMVTWKPARFELLDNI